MTRPASRARWKFASVCASIPCAASTSRTAPSQASSDRDTSYVKSTWPGVSIRFSSKPSCSRRTAWALIVMPALALQVHLVQVLGAHVAALDGVGQLQQAVGQRRLAVVDVRHDAEVADVGDVRHEDSMVRAGRPRTCEEARSEAAGSIEHSWRTSSPRSNGISRTTSARRRTRPSARRSRPRRRRRAPPSRRATPRPRPPWRSRPHARWTRPRRRASSTSGPRPVASPAWRRPRTRSRLGRRRVVTSSAPGRVTNGPVVRASSRPTSGRCTPAGAPPRCAAAAGRPGNDRASGHARSHAGSPGCMSVREFR